MAVALILIITVMVFLFVGLTGIAFARLLGRFDHARMSAVSGNGARGATNEHAQPWLTVNRSAGDGRSVGHPEFIDYAIRNRPPLPVMPRPNAGGVSRADAHGREGGSGGLGNGDLGNGNSGNGDLGNGSGSEPARGSSELAHQGAVLTAEPVRHCRRCGVTRVSRFCANCGVSADATGD